MKESRDPEVMAIQGKNHILRPAGQKPGLAMRDSVDEERGKWRGNLSPI